MANREGGSLASHTWTLKPPSDPARLRSAHANHHQLAPPATSAAPLLVTLHDCLHLSSPPPAPTPCLPATFSPHAKSITRTSEGCLASGLVPPPLKPTSPPPLSRPDPSAQAQICSGRTGRPALLADSRAQSGFSSCQRRSLRITKSGESPLKDSNNVYCAVTLGAPNSTLLMISLK